MINVGLVGFGLAGRAFHAPVIHAVPGLRLAAIVQRDGYWSGTTWARRKSGSVYREWRSIRAVRDQAGKVTHYVVVFYEVGVARPREDGSQKQEGSLKA